MIRRRKPEDVVVRPFGNFGYGYGFDDGSMRSRLALPGDPGWTMDELREAWRLYRGEYLERRQPRTTKSWGELVFDDGMDPEAAREQVASHTSP